MLIITGLNDMFTFYLHSRLDTAEGYTASLLRLDRYAHWKEYKYDELFLRLVGKYPIQLGTLDLLGSYGMTKRYVHAHTLRYLLSGHGKQNLGNLGDLATESNIRRYCPKYTFRSVETQL